MIAGASQPHRSGSGGEPVKALVIGYGSIGARHADVLTALGCSVAVLSRRAVDAPLVFSDLAVALAVHAPDYVVIANETDQHYPTLGALAKADFRGTVMVEKPLFMHSEPIPANHFRQASVAYNLRFHPVIQRLKELIAGEQVLSVNAYVGQYLPDWRPEVDYRTSYSAMADRGGGVLRDLSHELDYLNWMLGGWNSVAALGGHVSPLEITSEDAFSLLMTTVRCPIVSVHLNYLERVATRSITINTSGATLHADLIKGTVRINQELQTFQTERNTTYRAMHQTVLAGAGEIACSFPEATDTLALIEAAVRAADTRTWITK